MSLDREAYLRSSRKLLAQLFGSLSSHGWQSILVLLLSGTGHTSQLGVQSALARAILVFPTISRCSYYLDWTSLPSKTEVVSSRGVRGNPKVWGGLHAIPFT